MIDPLAFDYAGTAQKLRDMRDLAGEVVVTCSVIANFIPKIEAVTNPIFKRIYGAFANTVNWLAGNWRNHV